MVRLKVIFIIIINIKKIISIPYGAIKRITADIKFYADYYISIPYGAIKSSISTPLIAVTASFQFLMVRLKGSNRRYLTI